MKYLQLIKDRLAGPQGSNTMLSGFLLSDGTFMKKGRDFCSHHRLCMELIPEAEGCDEALRLFMAEGHIRFYYKTADMLCIQIEAEPTREQYEFIELAEFPDKLVVEIGEAAEECPAGTAGKAVVKNLKKHFKDGKSK